jgi:hypothetical protein
MRHERLDERHRCAGAGHSYALSLTSHDDNYAGDPTFMLYDNMSITSASSLPVGIVNGGFESGSLSGGTTSGASAFVLNSGVRGDGDRANFPLTLTVVTVASTDLPRP